MAAINVLTGNVTVASTSDLKTLVEAIDPFEWRLAVTAPEYNTVSFNAPTILNSRKVGPYTWSATVRGRFPAAAPALGSGANLTFAAGDDTFVQSYNLTLESVVAPPFASMDAAGAVALVQQPGPVQWGGNFTVRMDAAAAADFIEAQGSVGTAATFKLADEGANTDDTLAGNIIIAGVDPSLTVPGAAEIAYRFVGNGNVTSAGENPLFTAGTIGTPDVTEIVFVADSNRTFTGDAFWSSVAIDAAANGELIVTATLTGTGALTPA
jgi:hypothetical protein